MGSDSRRVAIVTANEGIVSGSLQVRSVQVELSKSDLAKTQARTKTELVLGADGYSQKLFQRSWERWGLS